MSLPISNISNTEKANISEGSSAKTVSSRVSEPTNSRDTSLLHRPSLKRQGGQAIFSGHVTKNNPVTKASTPEQILNEASTETEKKIFTLLTKLVLQKPSLSFQKTLDIVCCRLKEDGEYDVKDVAKAIVALTKDGDSIHQEGNKVVNHQEGKKVINKATNISSNFYVIEDKDGNMRAFTEMEHTFAALEKFWKEAYGEDNAQKYKNDAKNIVHQDNRFWDEKGNCLLNADATKALFGTEKLVRKLPSLTVKNKKVLNQMVSFVERPDAEYATGKDTYVQTTCHFSDLEGKLRYFNSASSVAIKNHSFNDYLVENANQAFVANMHGEKICGRSARSDTPERVLDLIKTNAYVSMLSKNKPGLTINEKDNTITYQFSFTSGQDRSELKHIAGAVSGGEDEVKSIQNIERSINELWPTDDYILEVTLGNSDDPDKNIVVQIPKPIFKTQILSSEAKQDIKHSFFDNNVEENRKANEGPSQREFQMLRTVIQKDIVLPEGVSQEDAKLAKEINEKFKSCMKKIPRLITEEFLSGTLLNQIEKMPDGAIKSQLMKRYFALEGVCYNLSGTFMRAEMVQNKEGKFVRGDRLTATNKDTAEYDQAKVIMCDMYLHEVLNIDESYQCKSGCDRTLTLTAMKTAMCAFEKEKGHPFNPFHLKGEELKHVDERTDPISKEHIALAGYFRGAALTLGSNIVEMVRGEPEVKWGGHYVPRLFYNTNLADPIPGLIGLKTGEEGLSPKEKAKLDAVTSAAPSEDDEDND